MRVIIGLLVSVVLMFHLSPVYGNALTTAGTTPGPTTTTEQCAGFRCFVSRECLSYVKFCNGVQDCADGTDEYPAVCSSNEPLGVCQPITPSAEFICTHLLPYENTSLPNYLNQTTQTASLPAALALNRASGCHPSFEFLVCTTLFPKCEDDQQTPPCRELCDEVRASCEGPLQDIGEEWPRSCEDLPSRDDEECLEPTSGACEPFPESFQGVCEPLTGYNTVSFPNAFGHLSFQQMITSREYSLFGSILGNISAVCYPSAYTAFCRMFLPQCENGMQIQLCRSVCEEMDARCSPVGLGLPFSCDVFPDRGDDPTCSLVEQPAECEPIRYSGCMGLSYSQTSFPNLLQWPSQDVALGAAPFVFPQFDQISDCHPDLNFFLCSVFFPQCTSEGQIPPCRSFCYEINATCGERALTVGAQWDASICPQLPEDNCSLPNADRATTPASTTQGPTTTTASRATASASTTQGQRTTAEQCTRFRCFVSRECLSYVKFCNGVQDCADGTDEYPAVCSSNEPLGVCQPITPSAEFICTHLLPYENTSLPNYLNQTTQTASLPAALALNRASGCHPSFTFLVCTTLFPKCEDDQQTPPCRELCDEVRASCEGPLQAIGEEWPRSCEDLPSRGDAECLEPTSGACEPFPQAFQDICEPLTGYNTVSFPNAFGHLSFQQMITSREYLFFGSNLGNISTSCYPSVYTAFCRMFLPQCDNGTQIQLCRSVCEEIDAKCSPVGLGLSFSCDAFPDQGDDPTCSPVEQPAECEPIQYSGCMGLSYSQTSFPNLFLWPNQAFALQLAPTLFPTYDQISDCHPDLNFFFCSILFPQCTSEGQILPCRSFCHEINATCGERALAAGVQWDASICPRLSEDSCSLPNADRATTPANTTQGPTTTTASRATVSASATEGQRTTAEQCTGFRCFVSRECLSYVKFCNGVQDCADGTDEYPAVCSSNEPLGVCQPITPSAEFICTHLLPYENTSLPNYLNQTSQTASLPAALALNRASECHPSFEFLVCTTLFPKCEDDQQTPPCRELCDEVRASCEGPLQDIGEEWPRSCEDLPSRDDEECLEPTSGACEPFPQAFQGICEPLTGYNTVSFPNAFGHLSFQQMITSREYLFFGSNLGNISTSCYPSVYTAFCRMFLPQCDNGTQIQMCRSVCEEIDAKCSPVGLGLSFSCDVFPDQGNDPTCSLVEQAAECEPIQYSGCMGLSYSQTSFPNIFLWPNQDFALQLAPTLFPTYDSISDCHPDLNFFLCSILFPQCTSEGQILPCRSFCHEINATCGERALAAGVEWDASICPRLSEDSCSLPNADRATTPSNTTPGPTTTTASRATASASITEGQRTTAEQCTGFRCFVSRECLSYVKFCNGVQDCADGTDEYPAVCSSDEPLGVCQPITPSAEFICTHLLPYENTSLPNYLNQTSQTASLPAALALNRASGCHPSFEFLVCTTLFPKCEDDQQTPPCRELCDEVRASCEGPLQDIGEEWPRSCEDLPSRDDEECLEPTSGACEPFPQAFQGICEPLTGYNTVSFPNAFGHLSFQQMITSREYMFFGSNLGNISTSCYPSVYTAFCRMFLPQCDNGTQVQLCRSVCEEIDAKCSPIGLGLSFSCDVFPDQGDDPTCSLVEQAAECEPIQYSGCMGLSYSQTSFPNIFLWPNQDFALQLAPTLFPTYDSISDCHPDLNFFLCSILFPQCTSEGQILPCRSFCHEINATCGERALAAGVEWDASICQRLSEDSCSLPNANTESTTRPTTTQPLTPPTPLPTEPSTTTTQLSTTQSSGCEYGGQMYPPGTTIYETPGCDGGGAACNENGEILNWDNFGVGCCEHNGEYYEDGTVLTVDGTTCICHGRDGEPPVPMVCGETTTPPLTTEQATTPRTIGKVKLHSTLR
ncbi:uncharacterized protein [Branchiostoma lanceolatum]|uniref:uncharacterized protein isoform X1 n=1 Tax=Branchiostoma lanceolatum TaxID=7740 RepID=UPI0034515814